jgi:hypothetical protein
VSPSFPVVPARPGFEGKAGAPSRANGRRSTRLRSVPPTSMNIKSLAEPKARHMPKWVRSVVPPLFGGLLGGAITFVALLIATIAYLDVLHEFQTLVSGILAIIASLVVLFGVYVRLSYDRKVEENKLRRDAFAFATALLRQTEDFQSQISLIYHLCNSAARDGSYEHGVRRFCEDMHEITVPELFEAPWKDIGLLNPDITLLIHSIERNLQLAKSLAAANPWIEKQPVIPGLANPFSVVNEPEKRKTQSEMGYFLRQQVGYYEDMIVQDLQALIICLEAEAEEYAMQLGLDEKRKWLRARAKARRDTRKQSGGA